MSRHRNRLRAARVERQPPAQNPLHLVQGGLAAPVSAVGAHAGPDASANAAPLAYTGEGGAGGNAPLRRWAWAPVARDANADTLRTLPLQRGQSRELARTHPIAVGAMGTYLDRVVGTGLALAAQPDRRVLGWSEEQAAEWKRNVQAEFSIWADSAECDLTAAGDFYDRQRVVAGSRAESGDCFTLLVDAAGRSTAMPYRLRLQLLEADRIGNPNLAMDSAAEAGGVRRDANGCPIAYHVYRQHPGTALPSEGNRHAGQWIDAVGPSGRRRLLHHWQPTRPEQTRGVPWFAPIVALLKDLDTFTDAAIKNAIVSTFVTAFITTPAGTGPAPVFGVSDAQAAASGGEVSMGPAAIVGLAQGEDVKLADPNHPNPNFQPFVEAICVQIGMALSIPFELLLKRFNASYSASRAALLDAWMFFRTQRTWLARSFCQPVYQVWLAEAVATNRIAAPGFFADPMLRWAYTRAWWHGDSQGSINPKDEVAAYTAAIDARLLSRERAEWELFGTDWQDGYDLKKAEHDRLAADGMLPVPKAGAAAPESDDPPKPTPAEQVKPTPAEQATLQLVAAVAALAAREAPAMTINLPKIDVRAGDTHVTTPPVTVEGHEISVMLPDGCIQLEATIEAPPVTVNQGDTHVHVPPRQAMRTVYERDAHGELHASVATPLGQEPTP